MSYMKTLLELEVGDEVAFRYLPITAPDRIVRGVVIASPWEDPDGIWLDVTDEFGVTRTARIEDIVEHKEAAAQRDR